LKEKQEVRAVLKICGKKSKNTEVILKKNQINRGIKKDFSENRGIMELEGGGSGAG